MVEIGNTYKILFGSPKLTNPLHKQPDLSWNVILKFIFEKVDLNMKFLLN
jgi:hypothetical protein